MDDKTKSTDPMNAKLFKIKKLRVKKEPIKIEYEESDSESETEKE